MGFLQLQAMCNGLLSFNVILPVYYLFLFLFFFDMYNLLSLSFQRFVWGVFCFLNQKIKTIKGFLTEHFCVIHFDHGELLIQ